MEFLRVTPQYVPSNVLRGTDAFLRARRVPMGMNASHTSMISSQGAANPISSLSTRARCVFCTRWSAAGNLNHPPADLYQERGYALDTQVEANFAVWTGLSVLHALEPGYAADRILIVGPMPRARTLSATANSW